MKNSLIKTGLCLAILIAIQSFRPLNKTLISDDLTGAWIFENNGVEQVLIFEDGYFSHTTYDKANKKFISTDGGPFKMNGAAVSITKEFDTGSKQAIGQANSFKFSISSDKLTLDYTGNGQVWKKLDDGKDKLAGTWKITGRKQNDEIVQIHQSGPRKTLKLLSGTRFQWAAINPETKEFFGTGGGSYTFENGKYTENIEFFSRDDSRVGASLTFDGKLVNGDWHHSGKSSKGDPIYEVWSRISQK